MISPHAKSIAALRRAARYFEKKVRISIFTKRSPLQSIYFQKWCAFETAADYLACLKK